MALKLALINEPVSIYRGAMNNSLRVQACLAHNLELRRRADADRLASPGRRSRAGLPNPFAGLRAKI
jgi:hypothetical protein